MSKSRAKGSAFERLLVDYMNAQLPVTVERRVMEGAKDRGDVAGIEGVVIEAKNHRALDLGVWMSEAEREADNDGGSLPIVVHKRKGRADVADAYATMPMWALAELLDSWIRDPITRAVLSEVRTRREPN